MTQIKIEVPANDHIALSAMADALQRIATERQLQDTVHDFTEGNPEYVKAREEHYGSNTEQLNDELEHASQPVADVELNRIDEELEASIHHENTKHDEEFEEALDSTLDADGLPWDKRIHSRGKTRLSDNTWRLARKPNDKTDEEWTAYVKSVKSELKAVQDIPVTPPVVDEPTSEPTLDEQAVADLTPPVALTDEQVREEVKEKLESGEVTVEAPLTPPVIDAEAPVAPVTPPTSLTPPFEAPTVEPTVEPSDKPSVTTFQELMLYMTSDAKKRGADNDMIKATLLEVDPALTAIPLIATRDDLIPKFVTALEAKLS